MAVDSRSTSTSTASSPRPQLVSSAKAFQGRQRGYDAFYPPPNQPRHDDVARQRQAKKGNRASRNAIASPAQESGELTRVPARRRRPWTGDFLFLRRRSGRNSTAQYLDGTQYSTVLTRVLLLRRDSCALLSVAEPPPALCPRVCASPGSIVSFPHRLVCPAHPSPPFSFFVPRYSSVRCSLSHLTSLANPALRRLRVGPQPRATDSQASPNPDELPVPRDEESGPEAHHQSDSMGDKRLPRPDLGATFSPGDHGDFYMPELVAPKPQRVMPEVPSNMQEDLANLELEPRPPKDNHGSSNPTMSTPSSQHDAQRAPQPGNGAQEDQSSRPAAPGFTASYEHTNASAYQNLNRRSLQQFGGYRPKPSPFPRLVNPGENVPLSDEEKEEVLERARPVVLKSTDPEVQLAWAQDALAWVEVQSQSWTRIQASDELPPRPSTPEVEHQLRVDAVSIVSFLADQHHPKAEFMKGMWLEFGKFGYETNKKEGFLAYRRAAERGYARAEYRIGMQFESSNNPAKAIEYYQKGVAMGDSAANYRLGMMTLLGQHGAQQDFHRGIELIRFAAESADENAPQGAYVYGLLLARELPNITVPEQFLPYDYNEAKNFLEKAAYLGFAKAQLKMGQAYELCQFGCDFDPALSLHYNALAARQGESEADMAISKWFLCGYEGVFEKNEELAFRYAKRAAQLKMATAEFAMGYFYEIGMYVPIDLRESEKWYQKAGEHGNKDALGRIDSIKKNNTFSKKDHEQIAISRIKSQHGSQRGKRPERFKQRPQVLPAMSEDATEGPDSRNSRPGSSLPYPEDDLAPPNAPYYNSSIRPSSAGGPRTDRASSGFGIQPIHHASTEPYGGHDPNLRLSTNMPPPNGRGGPVGRDYNDGSLSAGWESAPQLPYRPRDSSLQGYNTPPQNYDQGWNRASQGGPMNFSQPQPHPDYGHDPSRMSVSRGGGAIPRRDPSANHQFPRPERNSSMTPVNPMLSPPNQRPDRFGSASPMHSPMHSRSSSPGQSGLSRASPRPLQQQTMSSHASSQPPAPPKKSGPSTFEEMGIPAAKNENDCTIM